MRRAAGPHYTTVSTHSNPIALGSRLGTLMFAGLRAEGGRVDVKNFGALQRPTPNVQRPTPKGRISKGRPSFSMTLVWQGLTFFLGSWALGVGRWALNVFAAFGISRS